VVIERLPCGSPTAAPEFDGEMFSVIRIPVVCAGSSEQLSQKIDDLFLASCESGKLGRVPLARFLEEAIVSRPSKNEPQDESAGRRHGPIAQSDQGAALSFTYGAREF
jgi:hypothetical protein